MIKDYQLGSTKFNLINENHNFTNKESIYTVIVGKNGTGKSRLLKNIIHSLLPDSYNRVFFQRDGMRDISSNLIGNTRMDSPPGKIIAISTSPFDKFPIPRGGINVPGYSYLGLRGLPSNNLGLAYISKILSSLIESIFIDDKKANCIAIVLNYLGYSDSIIARFHIYPSRSKMEDIINSDDPEDELYKFIIKNPMRNISYDFFFDEKNNVSSININKTLQCFQQLLDSSNKPRLDVEISKNGIQVTDGKESINSSILFLIQSGFARLRDVTLEKKEYNERIKISDASSGEQSVVMSFLGIASQIEDNSLVCIDEPEVCLHPEWQEKYIDLLMHVFEKYKSCQFLIATHSPQVISNLKSKNCYVMSMENGEINNADLFINRSADYQLAKIFKAPGFKNEYLNRIALNIFSKVSRRKTFDDIDTENYSILIESHDLISKEDPLYELIVALKEMYIRYGRH